MTDVCVSHLAPGVAFFPRFSSEGGISQLPGQDFLVLSILSAPLCWLGEMITSNRLSLVASKSVLVGGFLILPTMIFDDPLDPPKLVYFIRQQYPEQACVLIGALS